MPKDLRSFLDEVGDRLLRVRREVDPLTQLKTGAGLAALATGTGSDPESRLITSEHLWYDMT